MRLFTVSEGYKYILKIRDHSSKCYVAVGLPKQGAQTVARASFEMWISRFGWSVNLYSDKRTSFMSEFFLERCRFLVLARTSTTSFYTEGKAMTERPHRNWKNATLSMETTNSMSGKTIFGRNDGLPSTRFRNKKNVILFTWF